MTKSVLITGASVGIGAATARLAARDGWNVGINFLSNRDAAESVKNDVEAYGVKSILLPGDMSDPGGIAQVFAEFDTGLGQLDALVNNAGVIDQAARVDEMDHARLRRMFDTNTLGPFLCSGEAVRRMSTAKDGKGGVIVNVSSIAAQLGSSGEFVDYAASKGAIDTLTIGLAKEVAMEGIRVVGLRPGTTDTPIHAKGGYPDRVTKMAAMVPMQRIGTAEEVAEAIVWLMSDAASYVAGSILDVSGGR